MGFDAEELKQLQQRIVSGDLPDVMQINALVAELWRIKTLIRGKTIELDAARAEAAELEQILELLIVENDALRTEVEKLKTIQSLRSCQLEGRWSNCAVRIHKGGPTATSETLIKE